jgi:hypothetical protein
MDRFGFAVDRWEPGSDFESNAATRNTRRRVGTGDSFADAPIVSHREAAKSVSRSVEARSGSNGSVDRLELYLLCKLVSFLVELRRVVSLLFASWWRAQCSPLALAVLCYQRSSAAQTIQVSCVRSLKELVQRENCCNESGQQSLLDEAGSARDVV